MDKAARATADRVQAALQEVASLQKILAGENQRLEDSQAALEAADVQSPADGLLVGRNGEVGKPHRSSVTTCSRSPPILMPRKWLLNPTARSEAPTARTAGAGPGSRSRNPAITGDIKEIKGTQVLVEFNSAIPAIAPAWCRRAPQTGLTQPPTLPWNRRAGHARPTAVE